MKYIVIIAVMLAGYLIHIKIENDEKREEIKQARLYKEQAINDQVSQMARKYAANTMWPADLSGPERYRDKPVLTMDLQQRWVNSSALLFVGNIMDITIHDKDNYKILVEYDGIVNSIFFITELRLSLITPKPLIDGLLRKHKNLIDYEENIAIVANINTIESAYAYDQEGNREDIKIGVGALLDVIYTDTVRLSP